MNEPLEYAGYLGMYEIDLEEDSLHGEVIGIRDVITFVGRSVAELKVAFRESIEDYLEFCQESGKEPDKPFSGQLFTRVSPEQHRALSLAAARAGLSLNTWVTAILDAALRAEAARPSRETEESDPLVPFSVGNGPPPPAAKPPARKSRRDGKSQAS